MRLASGGRSDVGRPAGPCLTTMPFDVRDGWVFEAAEPGARIRAEFVGLRFMPDRGEIVHSLRTGVVDTEGKVLKVYIGNTWTPEELLAELERSVGGALEVTS